MKSCSLVVVLPGERVDVGDVEVAGEMVAHSHPVLGFIPVNPGMEATQTPVRPPIKLQVSANNKTGRFKVPYSL